MLIECGFEIYNYNLYTEVFQTPDITFVSVYTRVFQRSIPYELHDLTQGTRI